VSLKIGSRERIAVLTMSALILGGGLFPQPGVVALSVAAEQLLHQRYVTLQGRPVKGALVLARSQPPG
jgi:hypothetical protein